MKTLSIVLVFAVMLLASCKKDNSGSGSPSSPSSTVKTNTAVTNGAISFQIQPAGSINQISFTGLFGSDYRTYNFNPNKVDTKFLIDYLPPADYVISFKTNDLFAPPSNVYLTVKAGQTIDGGVFLPKTFNLAVDSYLPSYWSQGGTAFYYGNAILIKGVSVSGPSDPGSGERASTLTYTISVDNVAGVGTYTCSPATTSYISRELKGTLSYTLSTKQNNGQATIDITKIDPSTRTISGTINGILAPSVYSTGPMALKDQKTSGQFTVSY